MNTLPPAALWLGLAGLLPFLGALLLGLAGPVEAQSLGRLALAGYGAVILSFLGAVHWGLALQPARAGSATTRLAVGVVPALLAWVALLLPPGPGLLTLGLGILATAGAETWAGRQGLLPPGYLRLRWLLSVGAAGCLLVGALASWD